MSNDEFIAALRQERKSFVDKVGTLDKQYRKGVITLSEHQTLASDAFNEFKSTIADIVWQELSTA